MRTTLHQRPALAAAVLLLCIWLLTLSAGAFAQSDLPPVAATPITPTQPATAVDDASASHALTEDYLPGAVPTAAEVAARGERTADPADASPPSVAVPNTAVATTSPLPTATSQPNPEPAKYDVSLIGHRNVGNGLNFYSLEREIAVGQDLAKQVEQSSKLVTDPEITTYVNRIGQSLVRNSDSRVPFTIKVIDSGEINAFALPGGFFYVDSGLLLAADSEAELAAIMAHEIAHVAARHATRNMTKQQLWNMASIPLMFVGGPAGYAIAEIASIAVPMSFLKFSRDSEREADMLGLQYDYVAGYDPQAFIQFFERLKAQEKQKHSKIAKMFSTHPMTADRITAAQNEIQTYFPARDSYVVDTSEFVAMKSRLISLQSGRPGNPDHGANRPVLRKHTEDDAAVSTAPAVEAPGDTTGANPADERPTLKRTNSNPD